MLHIWIKELLVSNETVLRGNKLTPLWSKIIAFSWSNWGTPWKTSFIINGFPAVIRIGHILHIILKRCSLGQGDRWHYFRRSWVGVFLRIQHTSLCCIRCVCVCVHARERSFFTDLCTNMYVSKYVCAYVFVIYGCISVSLCVFRYSSVCECLCFENVNVLLYFILFYFIIYAMALSVGKRLCVRY